MELQPPINKTKKIKIIVYSIIFVIIFLSWAGLTRAGYMPNFLDIGILCPFLNDVGNNRNFGNNQENDPLYQVGGKPVIYLYPTQKQNVKVELDFQGKLIADYPKYNESIKGWDVIAYPDGHLIDQSDNQEYSYLFWEGEFGKKVNWDLSSGFVVKGEDTREFLQETLSKLGLTPREYNEFIVWWYPKMKDNKYNLIRFVGEEYTNMAPLTITPKPDSMLRVFMVFKPLDKQIDIVPQIIQPFERKGFTIVEWGGTEIK